MQTMDDKWRSFSCLAACTQTQVTSLFVLFFKQDTSTKICKVLFPEIISFYLLNCIESLPNYIIDMPNNKNTSDQLAKRSWERGEDNSTEIENGEFENQHGNSYEKPKRKVGRKSCRDNACTEHDKSSNKKQDQVKSHNSNEKSVVAT